MIIRTLIYLLVTIITFTYAWDRGFNVGYDDAMSDVVLKTVDAEKYIYKKYVLPRKQR